MTEAYYETKSTLPAWVGGILLPLTMLAVDPAVFRGDCIGGGPILKDFAPGCYVGMSVGMLALLVHLLAKPRSAMLAGVLGAAACFAVLLGLVLLPFSLWGLLASGIGALGFSPFVTALVIGRQAKLANAASVPHRRPQLFWLGVLLYVAGCVVTQAIAGPA